MATGQPGSMLTRVTLVAASPARGRLAASRPLTGPRSLCIVLVDRFSRSMQMRDRPERKWRPAMGNVTLKTVAEQAGVSVSTVSNAYNRPEQMSAEVRQRVL